MRGSRGDLAIGPSPIGEECQLDCVGLEPPYRVCYTGSGKGTEVPARWALPERKSSTSQRFAGSA